MDIVLNKVFKDIEHFTGEERAKDSEPAELLLWDNPIAGRRIVAKARQTTVRAYQQADGTLVVDEVLNMQPNYTSSFRLGHIKKREEFLRQAKQQEDGTYNWQGLSHSQNRTGLLGIFIGMPIADIWKVENPAAP